MRFISRKSDLVCRVREGVPEGITLSWQLKDGVAVTEVRKARQRQSWDSNSSLPGTGFGPSCAATCSCNYADTALWLPPPFTNFCLHGHRVCGSWWWWPGGCGGPLGLLGQLCWPHKAALTLRPFHFLHCSVQIGLGHWQWGDSPAWLLMGETPLKHRDGLD